MLIWNDQRRREKIISSKCKFKWATLTEMREKEEEEADEYEIYIPTIPPNA